MSYHGKLQTLKNGTADAEIQLWAYQQLEKELAELTDEEILEELLIPKSEWNSYKAHHCLKQIRAILRKAQKK